MSSSIKLEIVKICYLEEWCKNDDEWEKVVVEGDETPFECAVNEVENPSKLNLVSISQYLLSAAREHELSN